MMLDKILESNKNIEFSFLLFPHFNMLSFIGCCDVFRLANRELGEQFFKWEILSLNNNKVMSGNEISIHVDKEFHKSSGCPIIFVCAGYNSLSYINRDIEIWLKRKKSEGNYLIGIESGALILSKIGLLDMHKASIAQEENETCIEVSPKQNIYEYSYNLDTSIATAGDPLSSIDLSFNLLEKISGPLLAKQVASIMGHATITQNRGNDTIRQESQTTATVNDCRKLMMDNLETPLSLSELCSLLSVTESYLRSAFKKNINKSPIKYYLEARLTKSRYLLVNSDISIREASIACGFNDLATFSRAYKNFFGFPPSTNRTPYRGTTSSPFLYNPRV